MHHKKLIYQISSIIVIAIFIISCQLNLTGAPPLPRGNCPTQPVTNLKEYTFSDDKSKYVFILVDKSYPFTNDVLRYISEDVISKIYAGDRLTVAFIDLDATTKSIFLNRRSELLDAPNFPATPLKPAITPTLMINPSDPNTVQGQSEIKNEKIDKDNELILMDYYCEVGIWNDESDKVFGVWELDQKVESEQFFKNAQSDIHLLTPDDFEKGKLLYNSLYLASQMITNVKSTGEYTDYALIVFSDMKEWRAEQPVEIDLKDVEVAVAIHTCEFAIDCGVVERWENEFPKFNVNDPNFIVKEFNIYKSVNTFLDDLP